MRGLTLMNNLLCPVLDRTLKRDERFTWMYLVLVRKPLGPALLPGAEV